MGLLEILFHLVFWPFVAWRCINLLARYHREQSRSLGKFHD